MTAEPPETSAVARIVERGALALWLSPVSPRLVGALKQDGYRWSSGNLGSQPERLNEIA